LGTLIFGVKYEELEQVLQLSGNLTTVAENIGVRSLRIT
jgi:hypothetical protein